MHRVSLFAASVALFAVAGPVSAQPDPATSGRGGAETIPCPTPIVQTLQVSVPTTNPYNDFVPAQWNAPRAPLNGTAINQHFLGTFAWKPPEKKCCQLMAGKLTVNVKSNMSGDSKTSGDAGNDGFAIMSGGVAVYTQPVYSSFPFASGTTATVTWNLDAAALQKLSQGKGLSFAIQDDTMVTGAKLELRGCCVSGM